MHFFFPGNLIYSKPTCTEIAPNAGQTAKEGKKGRNPSNVLSRICELGSSQPHIQHSGAGYGLTRPRKGQQTPFPIAPFPSGSLGPLELCVWYRYDPDGFKLVQHFFPLKSHSVCLAVLPWAPLLLMQPSGTFSLGSLSQPLDRKPVSTRRSLSTL